LLLLLLLFVALRCCCLICGYRTDTTTGKPERVRVEILAVALKRN